MLPEKGGLMNTIIDYANFTAEELRAEIEELKQERAKALHRITEIDHDIRAAQKELGKR